MVTWIGRYEHKNSVFMICYLQSATNSKVVENYAGKQPKEVDELFPGGLLRVGSESQPRNIHD